jgi:1-deoxy-D-xylulose-5-phosphate reductoisomerase
VQNQDLPKLDWTKIKELTFDQPDYQKFPCLALAIKAAKAGGTMPTALCAADEVAVELFMQGKIKFTEIPWLVERVLQEHQRSKETTLDGIIKTDTWARAEAVNLAGYG